MVQSGMRRISRTSNDADRPNRVIVVLVEFSDVKMASGTKERMVDLWFSTDKVSTGSVNEYFSEASNGAVNLGGEVVGPFSLSHTLSYYANRRTYTS